MPHPRPFRFGVLASTAPDSRSWRLLASRVEDLGYSTLFVPDHFGDQFAPIPAMAVAAEATAHLHLGTLVLDNDFKHPVVTAKELATVDVLSGGRLEIGLGAGWMLDDYDQSGMAFDPPGVRVDRLEESISVIKGLFAEGPVTHDGKHYTITGLEGLPKPLQRPHPPILIGAGGPRMLAIAAREADIVGVTASAHSGRMDASAAADASAESYDRKLATLRQAAGDRFDELELNNVVFIVAPTDDQRATAEKFAPLLGVTPDELLETPIALVGTVDQMCETLEARRERWGLSYVVVPADRMEEMAPVVAQLAGG